MLYWPCNGSHTDDLPESPPSKQLRLCIHSQSVGVYGTLHMYILCLASLTSLRGLRLAAVYGGVNMLRTEFNELSSMKEEKFVVSQLLSTTCKAWVLRSCYA